MYEILKASDMPLLVLLEPIPSTPRSPSESKVQSPFPFLSPTPPKKKEETEEQIKPGERSWKKTNIREVLVGIKDWTPRPGAALL